MSVPAGARLMLVDTYGLVYRAFFALPQLTTTRGVPIAAAYGFTMMLNRVVNEEKPTHVIAAFDKGLPAERVAMFPAYKAHRQETPDDLRSQFALVRRILDTYRVPIVEMDGKEADDVIATLATQAGAAGAEVLVLTGDLDMLQIVDGRVTVLVTRRGITELGRYDPDAVRARFELEPLQLPDYRGLKGDPSDNLPGIPGVGEKTAIKLIQRAGSLDRLLAEPDLAPTPKLANLVREHGATARVCRDVSLVVRDLPVAVDWEAARWGGADNDALYALYRDLEFKGLLNKLEPPAATVDVAPEETLSGAYVTFVPSTDPPDFVRLARLLDDAAAQGRVAIALRGDALGVATREGSALAFGRSALDREDVAAAFARLWREVPQLVVHDVKGTIAALRLPIRAVADDPMIAAHLVDPARSYTDVAAAASTLLHVTLPDDDAAAAADAAWRLAIVARAELERRDQAALYTEIELPLATLLAAMERAGIALDPAALGDLALRVDADVTRLQAEIYDLAGETFNLGSPQQLGRILFDKLNLPGAQRTKTGYATGAEILQSLARSFPIAAKVLEWREVSKLKSTYVDVLPDLVDAHGRVHTVFNQTATATGRLSSTNPNLQNIPVRSDLGRQVRRAFVAGGRDRILLAADYSQIELRLMAHLSGDAAMIEAFRAGADIHDVTARRIFDVGPLAPVTPNQRRMAKSVNFGLLYGMSDFGLAQRLEIERSEARRITETYFAQFPSVRDYIERSLESGREKGYVETILGRRRYMPDLRARNYAVRAAAEREATNAPLQGSAADLMKRAMVRIAGALRERELDATMLLQIHDELIFEVHGDHVDATARLVKNEMEGAVALAVPLVATLKTGANWYEVESYDVDDDVVV